MATVPHRNGGRDPVDQVTSDMAATHNMDARGRELAGVLFNIERYGRWDAGAPPAPLYIVLAGHLRNSAENRAKLIELLTDG